MSAKRPAEETGPVLRNTRIKLASPSPEKTGESDTESIHSCQGYKTELATDTSDTSSPLPSSSAAPHQAEYEVVEPEEQQLNFYFSSEDESEPESFQREVTFGSSSEVSDIAVLGDTSEENSTSPTSNSDVDPELPRNDYLDFERCLLCKTDKKNISYPYCSSCFTWKKNFFPSRPKRRPKDFKRHSFGGGSGSVGLFEDSGLGSTETAPSEDTVDGPSQTSEPSQPSTSNSSNTNNSENSELCRVCFLKPENGLFVHLKTAHRYGCYCCAKKIWYSNRSCPLCRRKVYKVTQLFI